MAHFAQLNNENTVIQVIVVNNDIITDNDGIEQESLGISFCKSLYGEDTIWLQTSYNGNFRGAYAGIDIMKYDSALDIFYIPKNEEDTNDAGLLDTPN